MGTFTNLVSKKYSIKDAPLIDTISHPNLVKMDDNVKEAPSGSDYSGPEESGCWSYPAEIAISKGNLLTTIPKITKSFTIEFIMIITEWLSNEHSSVLHFTTGGSSSETVDFIPLIYSTPDGIFIKEGKKDIPVPNFQLNKWTHFEISQLVENSTHVYTVHMNGKKIFSANDLRTKELTGVKVYASCPWIPAQSGSIKNLNFQNFGGC